MHRSSRPEATSRRRPRRPRAEALQRPRKEALTPTAAAHPAVREPRLAVGSSLRDRAVVVQPIVSPCHADSILVSSVSRAQQLRASGPIGVHRCSAGLFRTARTCEFRAQTLSVVLENELDSDYCTSIQRPLFA